MSKRSRPYKYIDKYVTPSGSVNYRYPPNSRYIPKPRSVRLVSEAISLYALKVIQAVTEFYGVDKSIIHDIDKNKYNARIRSIIWYLIKTKERYNVNSEYYITLSNCSKLFGGGRNHSQIYKAINIISFELEIGYKDTTEAINKIMEKVNKL